MIEYFDSNLLLAVRFKLTYENFPITRIRAGPPCQLYKLSHNLRLLNRQNYCLVVMHLFHCELGIKFVSYRLKRRAF